MMKQSVPHYDRDVEPSPIQALASQLRLTREDTEFVIKIVKHNDPPLEWLNDPKVLNIIKQRKGRWVQEEEAFANFLNHEFCLGLSEVVNGTTKRAYLSSKLACTKMRISKKFKGQNTGKEVFECKRLSFSDLEINYYKQRHSDLEKKFIRSVLKTEINGSVKHSQKKNPSSLSCQSNLLEPTATGATSPDAAMSGTTTPTNAPSTISGGYNISTIGAPMPAPNVLGHGQLKRENHHLMMHSGSAPSPTGQRIRRASAHMNAPVVTCHSPSKIGVPFLNSAHQDPTFLSPSFTNQFQSMSTSSTTKSPVLGCPTHTMNSAFSTHSNQHQTSRWMQSQDEYYNIMESSKKRRLNEDSGGGRQFKPIPAVPVSQDGTSASGSSQSDDRENITSPNEASSYFVGIASSGRGIVKSESNCSDNDIPDLLVGFDKHVASMKKTNTAEATTAAAVEHRPIPEDSHFFAGAGCGESPYITSKSFDELHKYLGKGLSSEKMPHLDLNEHHHRPAGWPVGVYCVPKHYGGFQPSAGGDFHPYAHNMAPLNAYAQPSLNVPSQYLYRPSSTSNCSDLTCSD